MSKLFFQGRIDPRQNHERYGFNTNRNIKLGTKANPLTLSVQTEEREVEIAAILTEHDLFAEITVDPDVDENIVELDGVLNKPKTQTFEKTPDRNDPCSCGSGKKYKKCCGK
ncbi:MAG: SWIM/SEC-C metal-binding protein [Alteromonadaceae bacterium]|jgi:SWIM/SEC-C metal-binding protein